MWLLALPIQQLRVRKSFQFSLFCGCISTLLTQCFVYKEIGERILGHKNNKVNLRRMTALFQDYHILGCDIVYFRKNLLALRMEAKYSSRSSGLKMFVILFTEPHNEPKFYTD